jgi:hypothetical protein
MSAIRRLIEAADDPGFVGHEWPELKAAAEAELQLMHEAADDDSEERAMLRALLAERDKAIEAARLRFERIEGLAKQLLEHDLADWPATTASRAAPPPPSAPGSAAPAVE